MWRMASIQDDVAFGATVVDERRIQSGRCKCKVCDVLLVKYFILLELVGPIACPFSFLIKYFNARSSCPTCLYPMLPHKLVSLLKVALYSGTRVRVLKYSTPQHLYIDLGSGERGAGSSDVLAGVEVAWQALKSLQYSIPYSRDRKKDTSPGLVTVDRD